MFTLQGNETLVPDMLHDPVSDAFAAVVSAGRYVGPFRVVSSLGTSEWLRGASRLTLGGAGTALAYVEEHDDGCFVVGTSRWGPYHWISAGPRFDADGKRLAWIEDVAGGGQALWVDGFEASRAAAGSWDPHEGSPLSLPFDCALPGERKRDTGSAAPVLRAGHWQARIGESMTAPVQWMSDPTPAAGDLVGFFVRDGAAICWREYRDHAPGTNA